MKLITLLASALLFSANSAFAIPMTFASGADDNCKGCTLDTQFGNQYVKPAGTALDGASWIQADNAWGEVGQYRVWEMDLNKNGQLNSISSLFVAFDDQLIIKSAGKVLFNSNDHNINTPWNNVTDVIALTDELFIGKNARLNFYVNNTGGPTGLIWKGIADVTTKASAIPAPAGIGMLLLGLVTFAWARKRS